MKVILAKSPRAEGPARRPAAAGPRRATRARSCPTQHWSHTSRPASTHYYLVLYQNKQQASVRIGISNSAKHFIYVSLNYCITRIILLSEKH